MTSFIRVTAAAGLLTFSGLALIPIFAQDAPPAGGAPLHRMGPGGQGFGRGPGAPFGLLGELGRGLRELELTDAQREQLRGVMSAHQTEFREIGDRLRTARQALDTAITADSLDESAIRSRSAEVAAVEADAAVMRAKVHQEAFGILTAEQQAKARELKAQAQARMQERASKMRERRRQRQQQP